MKKDFDLAAAKRGATVCTRDGWPVRILCFDLKVDKGMRPIFAEVHQISCAVREYATYCFFDNGKRYRQGEYYLDLMMADDDYLEKLERGEYDHIEDNLEMVGKPDHIGEVTEKVDWDYWRRMYAGMAMQAFITSDPQELTLSHAESAVVAADALIEELKKQPDPKI